MKTRKQIKALRKKSEEYKALMFEILEKEKKSTEDRDLANLIGTPGWGIVEHFFEELICELLVPIPFDGDAMSYAIESQSRLATINSIEAILKTIKSAKKGMEAADKDPAPDGG